MNKPGISSNYADVTVTGGFWRQKQVRNREVTLPAVQNRFQETGRFDAFRCDWREGDPNQPHFFWDSDVAKWMESAAYLLLEKPDPALEAFVEGLIDRIEENQRQDGYFNIWYTVVEGAGKRFTQRTNHELYCAGHLIEAAVAYYQATGKDRFLKLMERYADTIETVFCKERSAGFYTPGHSEIELALIRLYDCTGEKRYLELSRHFVDSKATDAPDSSYPNHNPKFTQDHLPVREQSTAEGHAVRATYLYCAMADLAARLGDQELLAACKRIFDNIVDRRMYLTGGIGSSYLGEAFTIDYDLPNLTAYAETCAAIGLVFFSQRMSLLEQNSKYADTIERALYNGFLSAQSLSGDSFFYENPLEIDPRLHKKNACQGDGSARYPMLERQKVFECSCCPPNITRLLASLGNYLYVYQDDTVFVQQYMESQTRCPLFGAQAAITQKTEYPHDGAVRLTFTGLKGKTAALRIPGWCRQWKLTSGGAAVTPEMKDGYALVPISSDLFQVELTLEMPVFLVESNPRVQENAGRAAVQRGPLVYCLEGIDNGENLRSLAYDSNGTQKLVFDQDIGAYRIDADGFQKPSFFSLYRPYDPAMNPVTLHFIPYYAFANRGPSEMIVWIQVR